MDENVGVSFGLSVLVVVFFAVVLYQPDRPRGTATGPPSAAADPVGTPPAVAPGVRPPLLPPELPLDPPGTEPPPSPVAVVVRPTSVVPGNLPVARAAPRRERVEPAAVVPPAAPAPLAGSLAKTARASRPEATPAPPPSRRGAFTQARAGETLADVARRVYGSAEAAGQLWLANRDMLDRPDGALTPGVALRTP